MPRLLLAAVIVVLVAVRCPAQVTSAGHRVVQGPDWDQVTPAAGWIPRDSQATCFHGGQLWIVGGWSEEAGNFRDVWYSRDGANWTELESDVLWTRRHEQSAWVFQDKIWIAGGAAGDDYKLDSEVWTLELPADWSGN